MPLGYTYIKIFINYDYRKLRKDSIFMISVKLGHIVDINSTIPKFPFSEFFNVKEIYNRNTYIYIN
jgi:hypothetical protein